MARPTAVPARPGPQRRSGLMVGRTRPPATCWSTTPCERPGEIFSRFDRTRSFEPSPTSPEMTATGAPAPVGPGTGSRFGHCPAALPDTPSLVSPWPGRRCEASGAALAQVGKRPPAPPRVPDGGGAFALLRSPAPGSAATLRLMAAQPAHQHHGHPHRRPIEAIEQAAIGLGIGAINLGGPRDAERALYLSMGYHGRHAGGLLTQRLAATSDSHEQPRPTPETGWRSAHALRLDPSRRWPR